MTPVDKRAAPIDKKGSAYQEDICQHGGGKSAKVAAPVGPGAAHTNRMGDSCHTEGDAYQQEGGIYQQENRDTLFSELTLSNSRDAAHWQDGGT